MQHQSLRVPSLSLIQGVTGDPREVIAGMLERYKVAFFSKDIEALAELYDRNARIFDASGRCSYDGLEEWRQCAKEWFEALPDERILVVAESMEISAAGPFGAAHGFMAYSAVSYGGVESRTIKNRFTWIVQQVLGVWKVVHEHTSLPPESGGIRTRTPCAGNSAV